MQRLQEAQQKQVMVQTPIMQMPELLLMHAHTIE